MKQLKGVYPISDEDLKALPVKEIDAAVAFYKTTLGFSVVRKDETSAMLKRDDAQIGLVRKADHDPKKAGSCYFPVNDVFALRTELDGKGGEVGDFRIDEYDGKHYRVFFVRESENGYCYCFSQQV
jgi:lactoylglutathione lyase